MTNLQPHLNNGAKVVTQLSRYLFPTVKETDQRKTGGSKSAELLERAGYIRQSSAGIYNILPLGRRVLDQIEAVIDEEITAIGGNKCSLATVQSTELWNRTGRSDLMGPELFKLGKEDSQFVLAPTHEEEITNLIASTVNSYRNLPLRLYQIGWKYRNEARPRGGLLRCREFLMKDLYTFDQSLEEAKSTYEEVCKAYEKVFKRMQIPVWKVQASSGAIGGNLSHEFQVPCDAGEDQLLKCNSCGHTCNIELIPEAQKDAESCLCPQCNGKVNIIKGLEVGHTFLLGQKYSSILNARFKSADNEFIPFEMGCYGIGVTRLMAAVIEASHDSHGIIWPKGLAPFDSYVISFTDNCSEIAKVTDKIDGSILVDDRPLLSFSRKFKDALLSGIPNILVVGGKKVSKPDAIEWHQRQSGGTVTSELCL